MYLHKYRTNKNVRRKSKNDIPRNPTGIAAARLYDGDGKNDDNGDDDDKMCV